MGYAGHFGIPRQLISVSLETTLNSIFATTSFVLFAAWFLNLPVILLHRELSREDSLRRRLIILELILAGLLVMLIRGLGFNAWWVSGYVAFVLFIQAIWLLPNYFIDKKAHPEPADFWTRIERGVTPEPEDIYSRASTLVGSQNYLLLLAIVLLIYGGWLAGKGSARNKSEFLAADSYALIAVYGERYVLKRFDPDSQTFKDEFFVATPDDVAGMDFSLQKLGSPPSQ